MALNWLLSDLADRFEQANNLLVTASKRALTGLERLITNTPYPRAEEGKPEPELWGEPAGGTWAALHDIYYDQIMDYVLIVLGIFVIITYFLRIVEGLLPSGYDPSEVIGNLFKAMFLTVFWWPIAVLILSTSAFLAELLLAVSAYSTPDGGSAASGLAATYDILDEQISQAFGSGSSLVTSIVLLVPLLLKSFLIIGLICLWIIRYLAIYLVTPVFPILLLLWAIDFPGVGYLNRLGKATMKSWIALVFLSLPAALVVTMFSVIANSLTELVEGTLGVDSASSTMILADGAGVAQSGNEFIAALTLTLIGIALAMAMPLVAAGGPFALVYASNSGQGLGSLSGLATGGLSMKDVALQGSGAAGSIAEDAVATKNRANQAKEDAYDIAGIDYGDDIDEDSRFGSVRSTLRDKKKKVDDIREKSAAERAAIGGVAGVNAGRRGVEKGRELREEAGEVQDILRDKAIDAGKTGIETWKNPRTMAKIARENAKNSAQKAVSERELRDRLEDSKFSEILDETQQSVDEYRESARENIRHKFNQAKDAKQRVDDEFIRAENMSPEDFAQEYSNSPMSDEEVEEIENKDEYVDDMYDNVMENKKLLEEEDLWQYVQDGTLSMDDALRAAEASKKRDGYMEILEQQGVKDVYEKSDREDVQKFFEDWDKRDRLKLDRNDKLELLEEKGVLDDWDKDNQTLDEYFKEWRGEATTEVVRQRASEEGIDALDGDKSDKYDHAVGLWSDSEGRERAEIDRFMKQELGKENIRDLDEEEFDEFIKQFDSGRVVEDMSEAYEEALDREDMIQEMGEQIQEINDHFYEGETVEHMTEIVESKVQEDVGRQVMHEYLVTEKVSQDVRNQAIDQIREMYADQDQTVDAETMKEVIQDVRKDVYSDPSDLPDDAKFSGLDEIPDDPLEDMDVDEIKNLIDMTGRDVTGERDYAEKVVEEANTKWSAEENSERYNKQQQFEETGTTLTEEDLGRLRHMDKPVDEIAQDLADGSYEGMQEIITELNLQSQKETSEEKNVFDHFEELEEKQQERADEKASERRAMSQMFGEDQE